MHPAAAPNESTSNTADQAVETSHVAAGAATDSPCDTAARKTAGGGTALCRTGSPSHPPSANSTPKGNTNLSAARRHNQSLSAAALCRTRKTRPHAIAKQKIDCKE